MQPGGQGEQTDPVLIPLRRGNSVSSWLSRHQDTSTGRQLRHRAPRNQSVLPHWSQKYWQPEKVNSPNQSKVGTQLL